MNTILWSFVGALSGASLGVLVLVLQSKESKAQITKSAADFASSVLQRKAILAFGFFAIVTFAWIYGWTHVRADGLTPVTGVDVNMWGIIGGGAAGGYSFFNIGEKKIIPGVAPEPPAA